MQCGKPPSLIFFSAAVLFSKVEEESLGAAFHEMGVGMKNVTFLTDRETGEFYGSAFATFDTPDDAAMAVACTGMKVLGRPVNIKFAEKPVKKQSVGAKALQMRELAPRPSGGTHKAFFGNLDYGIDVSEHVNMAAVDQPAECSLTFQRISTVSVCGCP